MPLLTDALADKDWAVRVRAATLLKRARSGDRCEIAHPAGAARRDRPTGTSACV